MKVRECMTNEVRIARPGTTLREAAQIMARLDAGLLPVADDSRLVGLVTDRDIAIRGIAQGMGPDSPIREVMSTDLKFCFDDDDVADVLANMGEFKVRRLPVLNREKQMVGIVSLGDLATNGEATNTGSALERISKPGGAHSQTAH